MNKSITFKQIVMSVLNVISIILVAGSSLMTIQKYSWTQEPTLSRMVNPDAVLVTLVLSIASLVCATIAFLFKRKIKSFSFLVYLILVGLNMVQFLRVMFK